MFAQLVAAMAHRGYLNLEGGQRLVEFIVKQCAINCDEEVHVLNINVNGYFVFIGVVTIASIRLCNFTVSWNISKH